MIIEKGRVLAEGVSGGVDRAPPLPCFPPFAPSLRSCFEACGVDLDEWEWRWVCRWSSTIACTSADRPFVEVAEVAEVDG